MNPYESASALARKKAKCNKALQPTCVQFALSPCEESSTAKKQLIGLDESGKLVVRTKAGQTLPVLMPEESYAVLLLDVSSSMRGDKMRQASVGAEQFAVQAFEKGYEVGLVAFASDARLACPLTRTLESIVVAIDAIPVGGTTNMADGLLLSSELLREKGNHAVVLVTDGQPDDEEAALRAAQVLRARGIAIIAVGTDDADEDFLCRIATSRELARRVHASRLEQNISAAAGLLPYPHKAR